MVLMVLNVWPSLDIEYLSFGTGPWWLETHTVSGVFCLLTLTKEKGELAIQTTLNCVSQSFFMFDFRPQQPMNYCFCASSIFTATKGACALDDPVLFSEMYNTGHVRCCPVLSFARKLSKKYAPDNTGGNVRWLVAYFFWHRTSTNTGLSGAPTPSFVHDSVDRYTELFYVICSVP